MTKILNGERGARLRALEHGTAEAFGLPDIYWQSSSNIDPKSLTFSAPNKEGRMVGMKVGLLPSALLFRPVVDSVRDSG